MALALQLNTSQIEKLLRKSGDLKKNNANQVVCQLAKPIKGFKLLEVKPFLTPCVASVIIPAGARVLLRVLEQCSEDTEIASFVDNLHSRILFTNTIFVKSIVSLKHPDAIGPNFIQELPKGKVAIDLSKVAKTEPFEVAYAHSPNSSVEKSHMYVSGATHLVNKSNLAVHANLADVLLALKLGVTKHGYKN